MNDTVINPIFLVVLLVIYLIIAVQFIMAKEYPMAIIWVGSAVVEAGFLWHVLQGGT